VNAPAEAAVANVHAGAGVPTVREAAMRLLSDLGADKTFGSPGSIALPPIPANTLAKPPAKLSPIQAA
jgi:hypothetical protein